MKPEMEAWNKQVLSLEILRSIGDIDSRISELQIIIRTDPANRAELVERVGKWIKTRFSLVHSFMDLNPNEGKTDNGNNPFDKIDTGYHSLSRTTRIQKEAIEPPKEDRCKECGHSASGHYTENHLIPSITIGCTASGCYCKNNPLKGV